MIRYAIMIFAGVAVSSFINSCAPQAFTMNVEMRYPSKSGVDLTGKSISVVYIDDLSGKDSVFCGHLANSFASELEKDYFNGNSLINIYRMEKDMGGNYSSKDTLRNLVMDTAKDVVFLFDSPEFGEPKFSVPQTYQDSTKSFLATFPVTVRLYVYDSMDKSDSVKVFKGTTTARETVVTSVNDSKEDKNLKLWKSMDSLGKKTGERSAGNFLNDWKNESYTLIYYDSPQGWGSAAQAAYEYRWKDAVTIWMGLLDAKNPERRSYAAYNIAVACYILGDRELSLQWLDRSYKDNSTSLALSLKKRITENKK